MDISSSLQIPMSPQDISKKYKRQSLGMSKASPSSSTKILGHFSIRYIFIASYTMCCSWSVFYFCFQFVQFSIGGSQHSCVGERHAPLFHVNTRILSYICLSIPFQLVVCFQALVFHAYFVQRLLVCFSYILLSLWSLINIIYESFLKRVDWR